MIVYQNLIFFQNSNFYQNFNLQNFNYQNFNYQNFNNQNFNFFFNFWKSFNFQDLNFFQIFWKNFNFLKMLLNEKILFHKFALHRGYDPVKEGGFTVVYFDLILLANQSSPAESFAIIRPLLVVKRHKYFRIDVFCGFSKIWTWRWALQKLVTAYARRSKTG